MRRASLLTLAGVLLALAAGAAQAAGFAGSRSTFSPNSANSAQLFDPYKNFRVRVVMDGTVVAGANALTGLNAGSAVGLAPGAGPDQPAHSVTGRRIWKPVTLELGISQDPAFQSWAVGQDPEKRKDIDIVLMNERGQPVTTWHLHRAWVSEYQAAPALDAGAHRVAITSIKIQNQGWERDPVLNEPSQ
jgi:phage tail-like protein